jgi:hypothetical protein
VLNYPELCDLAPDLDIVPVVQGQTTEDYARCADLFWTLARVDLTTLPRVGIGSVCRRQGTGRANVSLAVLRTTRSLLRTANAPWASCGGTGSFSRGIHRSDDPICDDTPAYRR